MRDQGLRHAEGFLYVYSIASRSSFEQISTFWEQVARVKDLDVSETVPGVIVGNKCDLEADRQVTIQEGRDLAKSLKCAFFETSAKTGQNVEESIFELIRDIRRYREQYKQSTPNKKRKVKCAIM